MAYGIILKNKKLVKYRCDGDSMIYSLDDIKQKVQTVAIKYNVEAIYLFGSYARGEATEESDLDFLVFGGSDFKLTNIFALAEDLREVFDKPIDVYEIHEVNIESEFYNTIMKERLCIA